MIKFKEMTYNEIRNLDYFSLIDKETDLGYLYSIDIEQSPNDENCLEVLLGRGEIRILENEFHIVNYFTRKVKVTKKLDNKK